MTAIKGYVISYKFPDTSVRILWVPSARFPSGHLRASVNKLLTYCVLRSTQHPTSSGIRSIGYGLWSVWLVGGGGMSAAAPRLQLFVSANKDGRMTRCGAVIAFAKQLPLPRL